MCSIIYQRGLYPSDQFGKVKKYGLTLLMAQDENVKKFITGVTTQLSGMPLYDSQYSPNSKEK
jgi:mitotic spindle assembly checkpoint protein MAD2